MSATANSKGEIAVAICPDCGTYSVCDPTWIGTGSLSIPCDNCLDYDVSKAHKIVTFIPKQQESSQVEVP